MRPRLPKKKKLEKALVLPPAAARCCCCCCCGPSTLTLLPEGQVVVWHTPVWPCAWHDCAVAAAGRQHCSESSPHSPDSVRPVVQEATTPQVPKAPFVFDWQLGAWQHTAPDNENEEAEADRAQRSEWSERQ